MAKTAVQVRNLSKQQVGEAGREGGREGGEGGREATRRDARREGY